MHGKWEIKKELKNRIRQEPESILSQLTKACFLINTDPITNWSMVFSRERYISNSAGWKNKIKLLKLSSLQQLFACVLKGANWNSLKVWEHIWILVFCHLIYSWDTGCQKKTLITLNCLRVDKETKRQMTIIGIRCWVEGPVHRNEFTRKSRSF